MPADAQHLHRQGGHRHRGHDGERSFEPFLVCGVIEEIAADGADAKGGEDAPVHGADQFAASRFPEIRQADRNDKEGFDSFPQGNDKGLKHDGRASKLRLSLRM